MRDWSQEDLSIGRVERAVLRYLYEDGESEVNHIRYEIVRVDRFESPYADAAAGSIFTVVVKELFILRQKEETRLGVLLATFQEDRLLKISAPIMSAHLGCL